MAAPCQTELTQSAYGLARMDAGGLHAPSLEAVALQASSYDGLTELCPAQRAPKGHGGPTVTGDQGAHGGP